MISAGARKARATRGGRRRRPPPARALLRGEGSGGGLLEGGGGGVDAGRVLDQSLQDGPLALAHSAAEGGRGQVAHVEPEGLGLGQGRRRRLGDLVRIDRRVDV